MNRFSLADAPPTQTQPFQGAEHTVQKMIELALGTRGEQSILVRTMKDTVVRGLADKDYLSEIIAVRNFAAERIRYSNDALGVEQVKDPQRIAEEINQAGRAVGDCDDIGTFIACMFRLLGRETRLVIVGFQDAPVYSHVFAQAKEPRSGIWIVADPVAGSDEAKMLRRVKHYKTFKVDS